MTAVQRRHIPITLSIGVVLTVLVVLWSFTDFGRALEYWFYDQRAKKFQYFNPPPTDEIVHLDIDDKALASIGAWPWDRAVLAELLDELHLAEPRVVALDILLPEAMGEGDERLAESIKKLGNVILPVAGEDRHQHKPMGQRALALLVDNLEMTEHALGEQLRNEDFKLSDLPPEGWTQLFIRAREEAMARRVRAELAKATARMPTLDELRAKLLPRTDPLFTGSPELRLLEREYERAGALRSLEAFSLPAGASSPPVMPRRIDQPPIGVLSKHLASTGFVDYRPDPGGVVRRIPVFIESDGRLFPQMGLAMACVAMGIDIRDVKVSEDGVVLPREGQPPIRIPVRVEPSVTRDGDLIMVMRVPWFGPDNWEQMYGPPSALDADDEEHVSALAEPEAHRHVAITALWDLRRLNERLVTNWRSIDKALWVMLGTRPPGAGDADDQTPRFFPFQLNTEAMRAYKAVPFEQRVDGGRDQLIKNAIEQVRDAGLEDEFNDVRVALKEIDADPDMSPAEKQSIKDALVEAQEEFRAAWRILTTVPQENLLLASSLEKNRAKLRSKLKDKVVLVGWIATGRLDEERTSLHDSCPGVVIHGVVFNGIMTGHLWSTAPPWVTLLITLALGLLATTAGAFLAPPRSLLVTALLGVGYVFVNAVILFDAMDTVVGVGAPLVALAAVWSGCGLWRFVAERAERALVTRRFRSYVDPSLVDYVMENPSEAAFAGQERELTVVFTDLAGFTALSEKLREKTVALLNEYMGIMVKVIRPADREPARRGYVNKFLGDGIMFFYGAPYDNEHHAEDAVETVLKMQAQMPEFNATLAARGLPTLAMRAGLSTGLMVVGDAGPSEASDYTVLGDAVNLGARLESANKQTGTSVLISDRTRELIGDRFLLRPVGKLQVVGRADGEMCFEPLSPADSATDEQKRTVELSTAMVEAYQSGDVSACEQAIDALDAHEPGSQLAQLYREQLQRLSEDGNASFDGRLVLDSK